jgi:magnesium-transporting ATPase (P-type)
MNSMRKFLFVFILLTALLPLVSQAEFTAPSNDMGLRDGLLPKGPESILELVSLIADWIFTFLIVLAVIFLLLAAFNYMGGSEEGVQKAHRMLLFTAVAVAVAFLAIGIVTAVQMLVDGGGRTAIRR